MRHGRKLAAGILLAFLAAEFCLPRQVDAQAVQPRHSDRHLQLGLGVAPGIGFQAGYVIPVTFVTGEAVSYFNYSPSYGGGEGNIQVSASVGGAMRIFQILREVGVETVGNYDLDFGIRFGPEFFIALNPGDQPVDPAQTFNLFAEPYVRGTSALRRGRVLFVELGLQAPLFRGGLMIGL